MVKSVTLITPTTGIEKLSRCIKSVQKQTYTNVKHLIVADGPEFLQKTADAIHTIKRKKEIQLLALPENTGANGFYGHRIYAATSFLVNSDYFCFLDQDNWIEKNHVETLVNTIEKKGLDWAFCHRNIYDKEGKFVCQDNCESLGKWPTWCDPNLRFVDTSCYCVKREVMVRIGGVWYQGWGGDRIWFQALSQYFPNFDTTRKHTLNYQLDGNPNSVKEEFFQEGNYKTLMQYNSKLPWLEPEEETITIFTEQQNEYHIPRTV